MTLHEDYVNVRVTLERLAVTLETVAKDVTEIKANQIVDGPKRIELLEEEVGKFKTFRIAVTTILSGAVVILPFADKIVNFFKGN